MSAGRLLVIWDIDGTLTDTDLAIAEATEVTSSWLQSCGAQAPGTHKWTAIRALSNGNLEALCEVVAFEAGLRRSDWDQCSVVYRSALLSALAPKPHAVDVLAAVIRNGGVNAVSSTGDETLQRSKLEELDILRYIESDLIRIYAAGDGRGKPSGRPVKDLIERAHAPVDRTWVVGNGLDDIASANAAGVASIQLADPSAPMSDLNAVRPTGYASSLREVIDLIGIGYVDGENS
jgi:phosphoglycolate phosphatase-like HAD superfamily hydrolase